jgi:rsbT antagonist protein RsbS
MNGMDKIPVMQVKDNLLVSIQMDMTDEMAVQLQSDILSRLARTAAKGVLIDISVLDMIDSFLARKFSEIAKMANTMDAFVVIVGMQPAIALTLVELGLELKEIHTALNVDHGVELLESLKRESLEE